MRAGKARLEVVAAQTRAAPEVEVAAPPGCEALAGGGAIKGPAAVVLCQLLGAHLPDIQVCVAEGVCWGCGVVFAAHRRSCAAPDYPPESAAAGDDGDHRRQQASTTTANTIAPLHTQDDTFTSSDPSVFRAASGSDLAVAANVRTASGWLFPLPGALLFLGRPPRFVRHADVAGVEFARVGATSSTFDVTVHLTHEAGGGRVEFGQIDRAELARLQGYVQERRLPVRGKGRAKAVCIWRGGGMCVLLWWCWWCCWWLSRRSWAPIKLNPLLLTCQTMPPPQMPLTDRRARPEHQAAGRGRRRRGGRRRRQAPRRGGIRRRRGAGGGR